MATFETTLQAGVKARIAQIIDEEVEKTKKEVERRIANVADEVALSLLNMYSVRDQGDRIVIEVIKMTICLSL